MKSNLKKAIENLHNHSGDRFSQGPHVDEQEWHALNGEMGQKIPAWFIELFTKYQLSDVNLEIVDQEDEEMEYVLEFVHPDLMKEESLEAFPGCAILDHGYICIAADPTGGGDPYFINTLEGDNPAVYQVYHDVSDQGEEILAHGKRKVADSLSMLFELGQVT